MDSVYGTLNLLILRTLADGDAHGLAIKDAIERSTEGELSVEPGALYPALHRLHRDGLVSARWGRSNKGRRARIYRLTAAGRERLATEIEGWERYASAVSTVVSGDRQA